MKKMEVKCVLRKASTQPGSGQNGLADRCVKRGCSGVFPSEREFIRFRIEIAARSPNDLCEGMDDKAIHQDYAKTSAEKEAVDGLILSNLQRAEYLRKSGAHRFSHSDLADIVLETLAETKAAAAPRANGPISEGIMTSCAEPALVRSE